MRRFFVPTVAALAAVAVGVIPACRPADDRRPASDNDRGIGSPGPPVVVRCSHQISGGVIHEYPWRRQSVIVGPVALWPAKARYPRVSEVQLRPVAVTAKGRRFASDQLKLQIIIEQNASVLLSIGERARDAAAFLFRTEYKRNGFLISEGASSLRLRGCDGRGRYTEYSTGLIVDGPRCLPLEVTMAENQTSLEAVLPIGTTDCES